MWQRLDGREGLELARYTANHLANLANLANSPRVVHHEVLADLLYLDLLPLAVRWHMPRTQP